MKAFDISVLMTEELRSFLGGAHSDPFRILGPHRIGRDLVVRVFRPDAREIVIRLDGDGTAIPVEKIHADGLFQAALGRRSQDLRYTLQVTRWNGDKVETRDPYSYGVFMGPLDLHLFGEGQHWRLYDHFGAHLRRVGRILAHTLPSGRRARSASAW